LTGAMLSSTNINPPSAKLVATLSLRLSRTGLRGRLYKCLKNDNHVHGYLAGFESLRTRRV